MPPLPRSRERGWLGCLELAWMGEGAGGLSAEDRQLPVQACACWMAPLLMSLRPSH